MHLARSFAVAVIETLKEEPVVSAVALAGAGAIVFFIGSLLAAVIRALVL